MSRFHYKKVLGAALASTMVVTGVPGINTEVKADTSAVPEAVSSYDLDGELPGGAEPIITGLKKYSGEVTYGEGHTGKEKDKAVLLGDYGIRLPDKNIGSAYTVSFWEKATDKPENNSPIIFIGHNDPEEWVAMSGTGSAYKFWSNSASDKNGITDWDVFANLSAAKDTWRHIVITGDKDGKTTAYCNGEKLGSKVEASALDGEDQGILLGVSFWDDEFKGYIDDVKVYDTVLSPEQVQMLYNGKSGAEVLDEKGFKVSDEKIVVDEKKSKTITLEVPSAVGEYEVSFESSDPAAAEVDKNGKVIGVKQGTAEITVTVKKDNIEKSAKIKVTVNKASSDTVNTETAVELDFSELKGNRVTDRSGNGNDAEIGGKLSVEDGALVFDGNGYLNLPVSIMDDLQDEEEFTIETTFSRSADCGKNAWLFNFGSNPKGTGTNYLFLSPAFGGSTLRGGIKDDSNEKLLDTGISTVADKEYTAVMVFDKGKVSLYLNGAQIGKTIDSGYSIRKDVIDNGCKNDILGYLAKSCWSADQLFRGKVKSFKIVDGAESAESIQKRFSDQFSKDFESSLTIKDILGRNIAADKVQYDLTLLSEVNENAVTWTSSDTFVITDDGKVLNDASKDKDVTLTAVCTSGGLTAEQNFELKVLKLDRTEIDKLIARAKSVEGYDANEALKKAVNDAESAATQTEIRNAAKALNEALKAEQDALYKDPFSAIDDSMFPAEKEVVVGTEEVLAELPSKILDSVKVSVSSENTDAVEVTEADGVIRVKAVKVGTSDVTVSVTADYDNFTIDYETRVKAVEKESDAPDPVKPEEQKDEKTNTPSAPANNIITESDTNVVLTGGNAYKINMSYPVKSYKLDKNEKKIIRVSKSGVVKVKKTGSVTLEVIGKNGESREFAIYAEVPKAVKKTVTSAGSFKASELVKDAEYSKPTGYKSSNEKVAKVSDDGTVTVLSKGSANITIFYGNRKVKAKVKVKI